jgi:archaellum component FlaG (FlaF/FlaG flagellin family)
MAENFQSAVLANETVKLVIKNTGSQVFDLSSVVLNSTYTTALNASHVINGSLTMNPGSVTVIQAPTTGIKINQTNVFQVMVTTSLAGINNSAEFSAIRPTGGNVLDFVTDYTGVITPTFVIWGKSELRTNTNVAHLAVKSNYINKTLTLDGVFIRKSTEDNYTMVNKPTYKVYNNTASTYTEITDNLFDDPTENVFQFYYIDITTATTINPGDIYYFKIITLEGYECEASITAV